MKRPSNLIFFLRQEEVKKKKSGHYLIFYQRAMDSNKTCLGLRIVIFQRWLTRVMLPYRAICKDYKNTKSQGASPYLMVQSCFRAHVVF